MIPQNYPLYAMVAGDDRWDFITKDAEIIPADVCLVVGWDDDTLPILVELGQHTNGETARWVVDEKVNYEIRTEMPTERDRWEFAFAIAQAVRRTLIADQRSGK